MSPETYAILVRNYGGQAAENAAQLLDIVRVSGILDRVVVIDAIVEEHLDIRAENVSTGVVSNVATTGSSTGTVSSLGTVQTIDASQSSEPEGWHLFIHKLEFLNLQRKTSEEDGLSRGRVVAPVREMFALFATRARVSKKSSSVL